MPQKGNLRQNSHAPREHHDACKSNLQGIQSLLARQLTTILPAMSLAEAIETTRSCNVGGSSGAHLVLGTSMAVYCPGLHHLRRRADQIHPLTLQHGQHCLGEHAILEPHHPRRNIVPFDSGPL
jgi:hypothetical protein